MMCSLELRGSKKKDIRALMVLISTQNMAEGPNALSMHSPNISHQFPIAWNSPTMFRSLSNEPLFHALPQSWKSRQSGSRNSLPLQVFFFFFIFSPSFSPRLMTWLVRTLDSQNTTSVAIWKLVGAMDRAAMTKSLNTSTRRNTRRHVSDFARCFSSEQEQSPLNLKRKAPFTRFFFLMKLH